MAQSKPDRNLAVRIARISSLVAVVLLLGAAISLGSLAQEQKAYAAALTWDGNSDGDGDGVNWSDELNWDVDADPTSADNIVIPGGNTVHLNVDFIITTGHIDILPGGALIIDNAKILTLSNTGADTGSFSIVNTGGTITNSGTLNISNNDNDGISNSGTLTNSGTLNISTTGNGGSVGIDNTSSGILTNTGSLDVGNSGNDDAGIKNDGTIDNSGILTVSSSGDTGVSNKAIINNSESGALIVSNTGGISTYGILNTGGTITNSGTLTVSNTGSDSIGISGGGTLTNSGTLTVSNTGSDSIGISGGGTLTNSGTIAVNNNGFNTGIHNEGTITIENSGAIALTNSGSGDDFSIGIENNGDIGNSGTIMANNSGNSTSIINSNALTNTASGSITVKNESFNPGILSNAFFANSGTITVENNADSSTGILHSGSSALLLNSGTITVSNGGTSHVGLHIINGKIENSGTLTVSNTGSFGIINFGTVDNKDTIINNGIIQNSETIKNGDLAVIENNGVLNNDDEIINDGQIINNAGAEIDNVGAIDNTTGSIVNKCGGVYNGNAPTGNPVVNESCDTTPPDTQITGAFDGKGKPIANNGKTADKGAKFFFIGSDNVGIQKFQCSLDGGAWTDCTSPKSYSNLQVSITHVFKVKAFDTSGNQDPTPATWTWKIIPPKLK